MDQSLATFLTGKPLADEPLLAAASAAVGTPPPVTPSASQAHPWTCLELLMLVGQSFSTLRRPPHRNLAGDVPALLPRRAKGLVEMIGKVPRAFLQDSRAPPIQSCEL
jgi:hypothetical protein